MRPTEKQKSIAEQSVYGDLAVMYGKSYVATKIISISSYHACTNKVTLKRCKFRNIYADIGNIKPILRPLSGLIKPITHKGYNDDKPFVPLVELAKLDTKDFKLRSTHEEYNNLIVRGYSKIAENITHIPESEPYNISYYFNLNNECLQKTECDLLNLLHFDTRNLIELGEAISTYMINPYEVK